MEPGVACPDGNQMEEPWRCEDAATVLAEMISMTMHLCIVEAGGLGI